MSPAQKNVLATAMGFERMSDHPTDERSSVERRKESPKRLTGEKMIRKPIFGS
jgi:hypothetical protein